MLALPDKTHLVDSHVLIEKRNEYYHIRMDDTSNVRYQTGIISESRGYVYLDISSELGALTFVFTTLEYAIEFLHNRADKGFINVH